MTAFDLIADDFFFPLLNGADETRVKPLRVSEGYEQRPTAPAAACPVTGKAPSHCAFGALVMKKPRRPVRRTPVARAARPCRRGPPATRAETDPTPALRARASVFRKRAEHRARSTAGERSTRRMRKGRTKAVSRQWLARWRGLAPAGIGARFDPFFPRRDRVVCDIASKLPSVIPTQQLPHARRTESSLADGSPVTDKTTPSSGLPIASLANTGTLTPPSRRAEGASRPFRPAFTDSAPKALQNP